MDNFDTKLFLQIRRSSPAVARIEDAISVLMEIAEDIRSSLLEAQDKNAAVDIDGEIFDMRMMSEFEYKKMAELAAINTVTKLASSHCAKITKEEMQRLKDATK